MKKLLILILLAQGAIQIHAQGNTTTPDLSKGNNKFIRLESDTTSYAVKAGNVLRKLKKGAIIVRLKTNTKSIDAYKAAGKNEIAQRIENDRRAENDKIYQAFKNNFTFCKVYFIQTDDTKKLLANRRGLLLNAGLKYDTKIALPDSNYVFCDYGTADGYSKFSDNSGLAVPEPSMAGGSYEGAGANTVLDTVTRRTVTDPASTSALFFSDRKLEQLHPPFPVSQAIHDNNFDEAVSALNQQFETAYYNLVTKKDISAKNKEIRKTGKQVAQKK